jgi:DNA-binding beta-propeller fold protein YncE
MLKSALIAALTAAIFSASTFAAEPIIGFSKVWTYQHTTLNQTAEIPAYDPLTNTIWVAGVVGVDVLDAETGAMLDHIDVTAYGFINSVAINNGLAAMTIESASSETEGDRRDPGKVLFYDTRSRTLSGGQNPVEVGALPDMATFTHDGRYVLVANEGTPNRAADEPYTQPDPAGSVSIIDVASRKVIATPGLVGVPVAGSALRLPEITGMDYEPEYIAVDRNNKKAYVALQEANGVAVLDLRTMKFTKIIGLGLKDFSLADNGFGSNNFIDPTDRDYLSGNSGPTRTELRPVPVKGLYQPDAIVSFSYRNKTYLAMANEGDTREDEVDKARASVLSGTPDDLRRLNISLTESTPGNLVTFGGRSFSIRDEDGNLVYDSGSLLDAEAIARGIYDDGRSDDKGVEPEGIAVVDIKNRTYAFVGLERTKKAAIAVFDVTTPEATQFIDMIVTEGDVSPEGLVAYQAQGLHYLAIANEVSNTTTLYQIGRE